MSRLLKCTALVCLMPQCLVPAAWADATSPTAEESIGWKLFFETALSRNENISCASCHDPDKGYGDGLAFSTGTHGDLSVRNSPSVVNLAASEHFFWDGRASTLEEQAEGPITNPIEMDLTLEEAAARIQAVPEYREAFAAIGVETIDIGDITSALAAFQKTLVTGETAYDRWLQGDADALTDEQSDGRFLFFTRGQCAICHIGDDFSDHQFHNIGTGTARDGGRFDVTGNEEDRGSFKTPSLRNWRGKEPFMHDGRFATMQEVIEFYTDPPQVEVGESELDALRFSEEDQQNLIAFMDALTGEWPDLAPYQEVWESLVSH